MGKQELIDIMKEINVTKSGLARLLGISVRTIRGWANEDIKIRGTSVVALRCLRFLNKLGYDYEVFTR